MKYLKLLVSAIFASMLIGLGGTVYLSCLNLATKNGGINYDLMKVIGSILFATGLYIIVVYKLDLFTGKVGHLIDNGFSYLKNLGIIFLGNLIGSALFAFLILGTRDGEALSEIAHTMVDTKLNDTYLSLFLLSIPCGFLMHFAVYTYKSLDKNPMKYLSVFLGVTVFILSGYEHVVANIFYITLSKSWNLNCILPIILMALGNALGAFVIPLFLKMRKNDNIEIN